MTKTVVLISPCDLPLCSYPKAGVEVVIVTLAQHLQKLGCRVIVVGARGSKVQSELIEASPSDVFKTVKQLLDSGDKDLIICDHSGYDLQDITIDRRVFRVFHIDSKYVDSGLPSSRTAFVSRYLRERYATSVNENFRNCPVIFNGIEALNGSISHHETLKRCVVYIGRISILKGLRIAAIACDKLNQSLRIFGGLGFDRPSDFVYNNTDFLKALLEDFSNCTYGGTIDSAESKRMALETASCLVIPSIEPESAPLVALEAASIGVPVVTFNCGGTSEYLGAHAFYVRYEEGRDADNIARFTQGLNEVLTTSNHSRIPYLDETFTTRAMVDRYLKWWSSENI